MKHSFARPIIAACFIVIGLTTLPVSAAGPFDVIDVQTEVTLASYQKVYIAPVEITLEDAEFNVLSIRKRGDFGSEQRPAADHNLSQKAEDLHKKLIRAFKRDFTIVDAPGEDVLTIEAEITKLIPSRPTGKQRSSSLAKVTFAGSVMAGGVDYNVVLGSGETSLYNIRESHRSSLSDNIPRNSVWQDADASFSRFSRQLARFVKDN